MDSYDVIIVGTGAGGGTLARHLAPSGKRILLLERGDWLPREPSNWLAQDVFVDNRYVSEDTWYDEQGKPFQPQIHYFVGGATKLYGAALYRLARRTSASSRTTTGSRRPGRSPTTSSSRTTRSPSSSTRCTARAARTRPSRPPARPTLSRPVSHEPRIQQLSDDLAAAGYHPFHAPCGIRLNEQNLPYSACVRCANCDGFPCAVHGKSDAEVLGVRPALEHPNVSCSRTRRRQARDERRPARPSTRSSSSATARWSVTRRPRRARLRRREHGEAVARSRRPTSIRTASPTAPTRSGATTCSTTARPCSRFRATRTRPSSRRRWALNDFYFAGNGPTTRSATSRWSASRRSRCSAARSRPRRSSRRTGRSSGSRSTRSTSGSRPRTCRGPRTGSRSTATAS